MKGVLYTRLLEDENIPIGVKLVYSQLLFRVIVCDGQSFDSDGEFDLSLAKEFEGEWATMWNVRDTKVADDLNITRRTVFNCREWLEKHGLISEDKIYVPEGIFDRYLELHPESGLSGWPLVVYSYIYNKNRRYRYVDTYRARMAKELNTEESNISRTISLLVRNSIIERKSNWKNWKLRCVKI